MTPGGLSGRRLTLEQADYQGCTTLGRPTLHFFWPLILCHLPPRRSFDLVLLVAQFPKGAGYSFLSYAFPSEIGRHSFQGSFNKISN
jgi:hypothetical protein